MTPQNRRLPKTVPPDPVPPSEKPLPLIPKSPGSSPSGGRIATCVRALFGGILVITLSGTVAWAVRRHIVQSPRFAVTDIVVTGQHQRTADALLEEAGLSKGVNVFTVDLDRARALLLSDPWIRQATLTRRLPGTLEVKVTEQELAALVVLRETYLVSSDGVIFKRFEIGDPTDFPVITGIDLEGVAEDREGAQATLRRTLDLASDLERTPLGQRSVLQEIHVTAEGGFTLIVGKDALSVALGGPPFRRKLEEAGRVTAELDRRGVRPQAIMLDDEARPERVVVRTR
jgi:cell division protein FtsQ